MGRLSDINLNTENAKVIREHHILAIDVNRSQEENQGVISRIETLLEEAEATGEISGYHTGWNFDENVTEEYIER